MGERGWWSRTAAAAAAAVAVLIAAGAAGPAWAQGVSEAELRALAGRAADDPRALAQLRAVREVDGRPAGIGPALADADGPVLAARLRALAAGAGSSGETAVEPETARRDAREVLDGRRFQESKVPRPLRGVLTTIGRWLRPVVEPVGRLWAAVADSVGAQLALVAVVFAVAAAISFRLVRRRSPRSFDRARPFGVGTAGLDPEGLEREAVTAERDGDLDRAVRLRFVAGVMRLDRAGAITYRSSMTTGQLAERLPSPAFAELANAFDEIAYGGRPAEASDIRAAREAWPSVLAEARR